MLSRHRHVAKSQIRKHHGRAELDHAGHRYGVDFFFVLSGFIILHAHMDDIGRPARLGRYLWRRAVRVYPIYWICLTLSVGALVVMGGALPLWDIALNYGLMDPFF
ncbi:MAG: acyltransferase, partial [Proteobacteria bacterium]|nr:acyltransferase [Pseudomonadota bacterium]